jgi:DNA-binding MarR family transcriptional regulator
MKADIDDWLRRASAAQRVAMERALAPLELTPAQFAVLRLVVESSGLSGADVARTERLTAPTMSVIIGNLVRSGMLTRYPHPRNARIQCMEATPLGREREALARAATAALRALTISTDSPQSRATILRWLQTVSEIEV